MNRSALGFVLGLFALGCNETLPGAGGEGNDGAASTTRATAGSPASSNGGPPACGRLADGFVAPACGDCAETSCCGELAECDVDSACAKARACISGCGADDACRAQCDAADATAAQASRALDACIASRCSAPCAPSGSGVCGTPFTTHDRPCDACVEGACCAAVTACSERVACATCLGDIGGAACDDDPELVALRQCLATSCATTCDG